jgi:asparagine synthase (glutamine-hydrolysing)
MIYEPHLLSELVPGFKKQSPTKAFDIKMAMDLDIKDRLPNDVLTRSDRSTSGTCLELRVPFLAHQLVDYSAGIDSSLFMKDKTPKYLIKKLAAKYIDREVIYRKKVGFDLPLQSWISNELKGLMSDTINNSVQKDYIDMDVIKRCFNLHVNKNIDHSDKLWAFLCLELSYKYLSSI